MSGLVGYHEAFHETLREMASPQRVSNGDMTSDLHFRRIVLALLVK